MKISFMTDPDIISITDAGGSTHYIYGNIRALKSAIAEFENPPIGAGKIVKLTGKSWEDEGLFGQLHIVSTPNTIDVGSMSFEIGVYREEDYSVTVVGTVVKGQE